MKEKSQFRPGVAILVFVLWAPTTIAQQDEPAYRIDSEVTVAGTVTAVSTHTGQRGTPRSRATLSVDSGLTMEIHIGPTSFVQEAGFVLTKGDRVTVIGSRVTDDTGTRVIVRRLTRGESTLELRNGSGRPLWDERHR